VSATEGLDQDQHVTEKEVFVAATNISGGILSMHGAKTCVMGK